MEQVELGRFFILVGVALFGYWLGIKAGRRLERIKLYRQRRK